MKVPQILTHIAGPVDSDGRQRCTRCDVVLKDTRVRGVDLPDDEQISYVHLGGPYVVGARIERGPGYQAMVIGGCEATPCEPVSCSDVREREYAEMAP